MVAAQLSFGLLIPSSSPRAKEGANTDEFSDETSTNRSLSNVAADRTCSVLSSPEEGWARKAKLVDSRLSFHALSCANEEGGSRDDGVGIGEVSWWDRMLRRSAAVGRHDGGGLEKAMKQKLPIDATDDSLD